MIKNYNKSSTVTSGSTSVTNRTNVEELIYHLCAKIASASNVDSRHRDDFINKSYSNMIRLFCSITYCPTHDLLETSQRIKNKRELRHLFNILKFSLIFNFKISCSIESC